MPLKFGVVGTAHWASDIHLPGLLGSAGAEVAGIYGRSFDKARAVADRWGVRAYERFEDLLAATDAVSIAIPPEAQPEFAIQAAEAGKHLLLEKPVATSLDAALAMSAAIREADVACLVFFTRRFIPEVAEAIDAHRRTPWRRAQVTVHSAPMTTDSPFRASVWRQDPASALWDIGPHALSVLIGVLGDVVEARPLPAERPFVRFETTHAGGAVATVSVTIHATPAHVGSEYRFMSDHEEWVIPDPVANRVSVFGRAAADLIGMIGSRQRRHPCGIELGVETVRRLAEIEERARAGGA